MNTNELNSIVSNIKAVDKGIEKVDLSPILVYCVNRHNEMVKNLKEIYTFVEKNFDIFENPKGGWSCVSRNKEYHQNYQIGNTNPYNCVIRDLHHEEYNNNGETRIYWVDEGIIFRWNAKLKRVCYLTDTDTPNIHGYDGDRHTWNDSYDFTEFKRGIGFCLGYDVKYGTTPVDWKKNLWKVDDFIASLEKGVWNEFNVATLKNEVDEDFAHAENVLDRLVFTLKKINESVMARQSLVNGTLDGSKGAKVTKYTIEITKTEN